MHPHDILNMKSQWHNYQSPCCVSFAGAADSESKLGAYLTCQLVLTPQTIMSMVIITTVIITFTITICISIVFINILLLLLLVLLLLLLLLLFLFLLLLLLLLSYYYDFLLHGLTPKSSSRSLAVTSVRPQAPTFAKLMPRRGGVKLREGGYNLQMHSALSIPI